MAQIKSLGLHTPVALPYLVSEGLLPPSPGPQLYQWETYVSDGGHGSIEEEVLATKKSVVYSQGAFTRNVYRFDLEEEEVTQALLTSFPDVYESAKDERSGSNTFKVSVNGSGNARLQNTSAKPEGHRTALHAATELLSSSRALVIFLRSKVHIHFLQGTSSIVDLPFDVERAWPAPKGIIIQRKAGPLPSSPPTPVIPSAPPNSFFSSQIPLSGSYLQSPTIAKSFASTQTTRPSPLSGKAKLDGLFQDVLGFSTEDAEDEIATLYSLTNPLSDVGVVSYSIQQQKPRLSSRTQPNLSVEFEPLDATEEVVYVSSADELGSSHDQSREPLTLIVTANKDTGSLTIWHAWYLSDKSLSSLLKQRAVAKTAKARRRSSFLSAGLGTGATTPAVRHRDGGARESFAGASSVRLPGEGGASAHPPAAASTRRKTRQEEEDVMASQMDPDYQPSHSQQSAAARESRRISSLNADVRASQHQVGNSFAGPGGRRNTSFGGPNDRRSLGHRKSRGSTPGSVLSRSIGGEDDLMDLDSSIDGEESVESITRHIRATFEAGGAESIIGPTDDGFKRDLVVRKIYSFPMASTHSSPARTGSSIRVFTLNDSQRYAHSELQRLHIYIQESRNKDVFCLKVTFMFRPLFEELLNSQYIPIPYIVGESKYDSTADINKLSGYSTEALIMADRGLIFSSHDGHIWPLPELTKYRRYDPFGRSSVDQTDADMGRNRTQQRPALKTLRMRGSGMNGRFSEVSEDGSCHRLQMQLRPVDRFIDQLLKAVDLVLAPQGLNVATGTWCTAHEYLKREPERLNGTAASVECAALVTAVLTLAIRLVDQKARAALRISRVAANNAAKHVRSQLHKDRHGERLSKRAGWSLIDRTDVTAEDSNRNILNGQQEQYIRNDQLMVSAAALADELVQTGTTSRLQAFEPNDLVKVMFALHIVSEEQKLCTLTTSRRRTNFLPALITQLGSWVGASNWSYGLCPYYDLNSSHDRGWAMVKSTPRQPLQMPFMDEPVGVYHWFEHSLNVCSSERYPTLDVVANLDSGSVPSKEFQETARKITPKLSVLSDMAVSTNGLSVQPIEMVQLMEEHGLTAEMMETLPEAIAAPFRDAIGRCEKKPPTTWPPKLLSLVGREDLTTHTERRPSSTSKRSQNAQASPHDVQTVCNVLDHQAHAAKTKEADRHAVSQLIFNDDRRLVEATALMHYNSAQVAECPKQPDWTDAQHLEQQRRVMQYVTTRMIALPAGDAMLHFDSQNILLTDKYHVTGFSNSCLMQPMGHTLTTDRSGLTEEKVNWAYFHAGVSAGLRISKNVVGIDTSWIAFNKPNELTNRHAGLLLALGLTGHLRQLAKWLSFKYLTPKHSMTSVGLLLGLSASYMGTMDSLITRMLSVHITRMLPPGAAELNVSPITQTAGLVGIGLLYYNTQHRRMSEVMLSEIEHMELEDPDAGPDPLRDESYRLAAGIALGFINLGKGKDLHGLHGMLLSERLLAVAVGPRPVSAVHVFDKATAGAVVAIAMVYMKSEDKSVARKIDIPDTEAQFDHVRPDMLMLRTMAKHLILWDSIRVSSTQEAVPSWTQSNLPSCYRNRFDEIGSSSGRHPLKSSDVPFFNVATGLALALSLKYAGSGNVDARNEILNILDYFYMVKGGAEAHYYDAKLTRSTVRRCIDVLALAAATVMAGTGDVHTFRHLRRLHGRTDADTPYGSHLAAHLAIGVLFLGGGTFTFGTSDLAIASLICAFYPLFPVDVHDNHVHLQALRHFWVFAVEDRCLVVEEVDTQRPISMPIIVTLRDGSTKALTAPCLLPELDGIATVYTDNPAYWRVTLDFMNNPVHLSAFRQNQRIFIRRCPASEAHHSVFSATLTALSDVQPYDLSSQQIWHSMFDLAAFRELDKSSIELILPPDVNSAVHNDERGTIVDDKLILSKAATAGERDALWNLRMLFAWAEKARYQSQGQLRWIGSEVVEALKAKIEERLKDS